MDVSRSSAFHFNPFSIPTAKAAWNEEGANPVIAAGKSAAGVVYDIFLKNPYDLTVGNALAWKNSEVSLTRSEKAKVIAAIGFGTISSLMLTGAGSFLTGRLVVGAGATLGVSAAIFAGETLKTIGKYLFLSGAVPIYGAGFGIKYAILKIPTLVGGGWAKFVALSKLLYTKLLVPLGNLLVNGLTALGTGIQFVVTKLLLGIKTVCAAISKFVVSTFQAIGNLAISIAKGLWTGVKFLATKLYNAAAAVYNAIANVATYIFKEFIAPAYRAVANFLTAIAKGIWTGVKFVATKLYEGVTALCKGIAKAATYIFNNWIVPAYHKVANFLTAIVNGIWSGVKFVATKLYEGASAVCKAIAKAATYIFNNWLVPGYHKVANFLTAIVNGIWSGVKFVGTKLYEGASAVCKAIAKAATYIFNNWIVPGYHKVANFLTAIVNGIWSGVKFVGTKLYEGASAVCKAIAKAATYIFYNWLVPGYHATVNGLSVVKEFLNGYVVQPIVNGFTAAGNALVSLVNQIGALFQSIYHTVLIPGAQATQQAFVSMGNAMNDFRVEVIDTAVSLYQRVGAVFA